MLKVGIIFPMQEEIDALKKYLTIEKEYNIFELTFYEGILSGVHVVLVQCGVGKVNAARVTQILIDNIKVDYIFIIGVAGGVKKAVLFKKGKIIKTIDESNIVQELINEIEKL